ncbi:DUF222 domain-containing protein [Dactylosporangium roseum]|uniref:DUF222 domain-containing protein n=1 Tax=Dactylosporangium roseum TaxID=47989 RepID=A0ABY5ZAN1_9ACTN|nr:HNH endonuclease signature motif containing protein [Dactylosporangium roseum]UWZ38656.1 DUF222 domain-containing protein [Dactylosporangium roseum]
MDVADLVDGLLGTGPAAGVWSWPGDQLLSALDTLHDAEQRCAAAKLTVLREIDGRGLGRLLGGTSTAAWFHHRYQVSAATASRLVRLAAALDSDLTATAAALADAVINVEQAWAIAEAVMQLPPGLRDEGEHRLLIQARQASHNAKPDPAPVAEASGSSSETDSGCGSGSGSGSAGAAASGATGSEDTGAGTDTGGGAGSGAGSDTGGGAGSGTSSGIGPGSGARGGAANAALGAARLPADPKALTAAGARLLDDLDPAEAERREHEREQRLAERAHKMRDFRLVDVPGTALVRVSGQLDREAAAILRAGLDALCSPRAAKPSAGTQPPRTAGQLRADAIVEIFRIALACRDLPDNGGDRPQLVVTVALQTLQQQHGTADLEDGGTLTAAAARRWACDAKVVPVVLGGAAQPLDVGRGQRLFTGPLRRALVLRDGGCAFPGCDRPPRWCDGHHVRSWLDGGPTSLHNAVLLCHAHHRLVHEGAWEVRINPQDNLPEFIPPVYVDWAQRPRRNAYHGQE